jgi:peptide/nickel transport system permease protein
VLTFIIRRLLWTVLVLFVITVVVFIIFFKTPGVDPARAIAGRNPSVQVLQEIREQFGLNKPLPVQYGLMMKSIFISRDLVSYSNQGVKVVPEIAAATPATLSLVFGAALIWVVMAIAVGVAAALLRGTVFDPLLMVLALIGVSAPVFWVGQVANMITQGSLHATFLFSWVPPLGTRRSRRIRCCGSRGWSSPGLRCRSCISACTGECCGPTSWRRRTRTSSGPPARRGSPSGGCCCGTRCGRP